MMKRFYDKIPFLRSIIINVRVVNERYRKHKNYSLEGLMREVV